MVGFEPGVMQSICPEVPPGGELTSACLELLREAALVLPSLRRAHLLPIRTLMWVSLPGSPQTSSSPRLRLGEQKGAGSSAGARKDFLGQGFSKCGLRITCL